jgi:anti-sigma B factor antagonist
MRSRVPQSEAFGPGRILLAELSDRGDEIVYALTGEIDLSVADELGARISELLRRGSATVVLDLAQLTFIDSSGCRLLVMASREAAEAKRRLVVRNLGGSPRRVLEMTGITDALEVEDDPSEAP